MGYTETVLTEKEKKLHDIDNMIYICILHAIRHQKRFEEGIVDSDEELYDDLDKTCKVFGFSGYDYFSVPTPEFIREAHRKEFQEKWAEEIELLKEEWGE